MRSTSRRYFAKLNFSRQNLKNVGHCFALSLCLKKRQILLRRVSFDVVSKTKIVEFVVLSTAKVDLPFFVQLIFLMNFTHRLAEIDSLYFSKHLFIIINLTGLKFDDRKKQSHFLYVQQSSPRFDKQFAGVEIRWYDRGYLLYVRLLLMLLIFSLASGHMTLP